MLTWLSTTDAKLTFIGEPVSARSAKDKRAAEDTMVIYCNKRAGSVCGGSCTVYNGGSKCLSASGTECLYATSNVAFCDGKDCTGSCHNFNKCGHPLDDNFCFTPGTASINVPFV